MTNPFQVDHLDDDRQNEIAKWLDGSPRKEGYQQSNWTLKLLSHHILLEFRTPFCLSRIWCMVHELGFTLIRPRHKSIVPTKEQITQAFGKISVNLEKAKSGETRFFYLDETVATILFFRHSAEREWFTLCYLWALQH